MPCSPPLIRALGPIAGLALVLAGLPAPAQAGCNQIATATRELPSFDPTGGTDVVAYVDRAVAGPGDTVTLRADLACDPAAEGFALPGATEPNQVALRFRSPNGPVTDVAVPAADVTPIRCGELRCKALRFVVPDTSDVVGSGLTGPAEIRVERAIDATTELVARVFELYQPIRACEPSTWEPDPVFGTFTVLPERNELQVGSNPGLQGAVDGHGNLVLPIGFEGVLQAQAGEPVATLLRVVSGNAQVITALGDPDSDSEDLRSFNDFGRPIPPVLRLVKEPAEDPAFVGTTDVFRSLMRVRPLDGLDYAGLMSADVGAVQLLGADVSVQSAAPLAALRASTGTIAAGADESRVGDRNGDSDTDDFVAELTDVQTGVAEDTGLALAETAKSLAAGAPRRAGLATQGTTVALLQSEARDGASDATADGDVFDRLLRIFAFDAATGAYVEPSSPQTTADPLPRVNGRPFALSAGRAFAREREGDAALRVTSLASVDSSGTQTAVDSLPFAALSADGRFVAFASDGALVTADSNGFRDVYVRDLHAGTTERVSVSSSGTQGDGDSFEPAISADGRFVAFTSGASNLVFGDANGFFDVFVHDRDMGTTERVSVDSFGGEGSRGSSGPSISGDGRFVAFETLASFVASDTNTPTSDVYVHDRQSGTTERVSVSTGGTQGDADSGVPDISADGRFVAFGSFATTLVAGDTNGVEDGFVHDRQTGVTERVTVASDGSQSNAGAPFSDRPIQISGDGRFVAFMADATNLVPGDTNGATDVFVHDRQTGGTERVSVSSTGAQGTGGSREPAIGGDGRYVAFESDAPNLVAGDANTVIDIFRHDRATGVTERVSVPASGGGENGTSEQPDLSADGRVVSFGSGATLVAGDANGGVLDVYVRDVDEASGDRNGDGDAADTVLTVLDVATGALENTGERIPATRIEAAAGRALVSGPESGGDLTGDGDELDTVARLWSAARGVEGLALGGSLALAVGSGPGATALSAQVLCVAVSEADQGAGPLNGDGDTDDVLLAASRVDQGETPDTNPSAGGVTSFVRAGGPRCVSLRPESEAGDLNGDGDALDEVLHVLEVAPDGTQTLVNLGWAVEDFILSADGAFVAFRTPEAAEGATGPGCLGTSPAGACDLNGDGDTADAVLQVVELPVAAGSDGPANRAGFTTNPERAAIPCDFDACEAFDLYRMESFGPGEARASFLGTEPDQAVGAGCLPQSPSGGCDLDGDGLGGGVVVHIARIGQGDVAAVQTLPASEESTAAPFPARVIDQTVETVQQTECEAARHACPALQDPDLAFGATFPYQPGSCPARFDLDRDGAAGNPNDVAGELDCVTLRSSIAGDSDRAGDGSPAPDGVLDVASNGAGDLCREAANPDQADADEDGAGDVVCDGDAASVEPASLSCDLNGDGLVTKSDVDLVVEAIGQPAVNFPPAGWDRRDRNPDGRLTSFDSSLCRQECDFTDCAESDPNAGSSGGTTSGGSCGLLGGELLLPLAALRALRRRRAGRR